MIFNFCFTKNSLFILSILLFLLLIGCGSKDILSANTETNLTQNEVKPIDNFFEIPTGNELKIETQRLNTNKFNVILTNISEKKVYCYYTTSPNGDRTSFHYYPEKRNKNSNEFENYSDGPDSLPALSSINPHQSIKFNFSELRKGAYRLTISYLTDENTAKLMTEKIPPELTQSEEERVLKAVKQISTPVMIVTMDKKVNSIAIE